MQRGEHPLRCLAAGFSGVRHLLSSSSRVWTWLVLPLPQAGAPKLRARSFASQEKPGRFVFPSLLRTSALLSDVNCGRSIHAAVIRSGLHYEPFIASSLISMYVKCGHLDDADQLFVGLPDRDATTWNSMVDGFFRLGRPLEGFSCFLEMQSSGVEPDQYSLSILLVACSDYLELDCGRQIHAYLVKNILDQDPFLTTTLIDMYAKCGQVARARVAFDAASVKNGPTWNAMIGGLSRSVWWEESLELYAAMKSQDVGVGSATFSSLLNACSFGEELAYGEMLHSDVIKTGFELDRYVRTSLLSMYGKCASIGGAVKVFAAMQDRTIELCNAMISAYGGNGFAAEAFRTYMDIQYSNVRPDCFTMLNILAACATIGCYDFGRTIHGQLIKVHDSGDSLVMSSLLSMYMKCGNTEDAAAVFSLIQEKDLVVWGSMISGLCQNKKLGYALSLLRQMQDQGLKLDRAIISAIACICVGLEHVALGLQVHGYAIKTGMESDAFVGSSLIDMYAKTGSLESAVSVFSGISRKNIVVWNAMAAGLSRHGETDGCLRILAQMQIAGLMPDTISITNALTAASVSGALSKGKMVHGYQVRNEIQSDAGSDNALLDMYIKCGCLRYAQNIFERMPARTTASWNSMISGYGFHGRCDHALNVFEEMRGSGAAPDEITFLALISSCSHAGLTEEGLGFFSLMERSSDVSPAMEHYASVVDLLGRAGRVREAYCFIKELPVEADARVWRCLLSACRAHGNMEVGELAADQLLRPVAETEGGGSHIQMWNLYGEGGLPEKAATYRIKMKKEGLKKRPGCSWIEVNKHVEVFFSGDSSSPSTLEMHDLLTCLRNNMKDEDTP